jgi:DTW domain-containing protein YfiP
MGQRSLVPIERRCSGCALSKAWCICDQMPKVDHQLKIIWIYHPLELLKTTSSTVIARRCLNHVQLLQWEGRGDPIPKPNLDLSNAWVLMPEEGATPLEDEIEKFKNLQNQNHPTQNHPTQNLAPPVLIAIDATWRQARRMVKKIEWLQPLKKVILLQSNPNPNILRRQHLEEGMSTLDAVAIGLRLIGETQEAQTLLDARLFQMKHILKTRGIVIEQRVEQVQSSTRPWLISDEQDQQDQQDEQGDELK